MTWFKVDDTLAFHRKTLIAGNAAMGLWARAGSWCAQQLTDGHISREVARQMGTKKEADALVRSGLWLETEDGYLFHQWNEPGRQPTRAQVEQERKRKSERQRRWRDSQSGRFGESGRVDASTDASRDGPHDASGDGVSDGRPVPSRPDPKGQSPSGFDPGEVTQSSSLSVGDAGTTPTDDDLEIDRTIIGLLAELTSRTITPAQASGVRLQILGGRSVKPDKRRNYVAKAIRERPKEFLPLAASAEKCPIHLLEQPCRSCAADQKAGA